MPAFDEVALLEQSVRSIVGGLRAQNAPFEVLVVENGSRDGTAALATRLDADIPEVRALRLREADYGAALRTGILAASGDLVATFDVDYFDLAFLDRAKEVLSRPAAPAIVVASKRAVGARDGRPRFRRFVTAVFSVLLRVGFGLRVSDTHGMKVLRRGAIEPLVRECRFGADLFDTELVLRTDRAGLEIAELPAHVEELRPSRTPIWRRVPRALIGLARLRVTLWGERLRRKRRW
jgi:glycosyltransferase involved in cell wall biosynthesis